MLIAEEYYVAKRPLHTYILTTLAIESAISWLKKKRNKKGTKFTGWDRKAWAETSISWIKLNKLQLVIAQ